MLPITWKQGQHLALVGETGTGKSTLLARLLDVRQYTLVLKSKPDDVKYRMYRTIHQAAQMDDLRSQRFVLKPSYKEQTIEFWRALHQVWLQGGWTVDLDELFYLDRLGLRESIERLLTQGRSKHITVVTGMQRPVSVTRFALGESRHILSFSLEGRDARELRDATHPLVYDAVRNLRDHEFVWYCKPHTIWCGRLNLKTSQLEGEFFKE
jgi:hypothetical protein